MGTILAMEVVVGNFLWHNRAVHFVTSVARDNADPTDPRTTLRILRVLTCVYENLDMSSLSTVTVLSITTRRYRVVSSSGPLYGTPSTLLPRLFCTSNEFGSFFYHQYPNLRRFLVEHIPADYIVPHMDLGDYIWHLEEFGVSVTFALIDSRLYIIDYHTDLPVRDNVIAGPEPIVFGGPRICN